MSLCLVYLPGIIGMSCLDKLCFSQNIFLKSIVTLLAYWPVEKHKYILICLKTEVHYISTHSISTFCSVLYTNSHCFV